MNAIGSRRASPTNARRKRTSNASRSGTIAYFPAFFTLPSEFLTAGGAAAAVGFINCTASIGGFVGPKFVGNLSQQSGSFTGGFVMMIACWIVASVLVLVCPRKGAPA